MKKKKRSLADFSAATLVAGGAKCADGGGGDACGNERRDGALWSQTATSHFFSSTLSFSRCRFLHPRAPARSLTLGRRRLSAGCYDDGRCKKSHASFLNATFLSSFLLRPCDECWKTRGNFWVVLSSLLGSLSRASALQPNLHNSNNSGRAKFAKFAILAIRRFKIVS